MTWVHLMFSDRIIKLSLIAQIDLIASTNMKRLIWNVDLEMFTIPELDWFSDGRWQTDVKWCGSDIKREKMSWMQETEERDWLLNVIEKKASISVFQAENSDRKERSREETVQHKNKHSPTSPFPYTPPPTRIKNTVRNHILSGTTLKPTELHQFTPAKNVVHWVNHSYRKENKSPKNKSLLIMCHPASLLCLSPKMSFFPKYNEELSQAVATFNSAPGREMSTLYHYSKQTPLSHHPSLWKHMQHVLKVPEVKLLIAINVFFSFAAVVVQKRTRFSKQHVTWVGSRLQSAG